ncbi:cytochrome P450 [Streptomycetaceae bacterium NBC_01309]
MSVDIEYDLTSPEYRHNPYPVLRSMQDRDPIHFSRQWNAWLITRYEDVAAGLAHPGISADRITPRLNQLPESGRTQFQPLARMLSQWPLMADPPAHAALRSPVTDSMSQRVIESFRPLVTRTVTTILDSALASGETDAVAHLAVPLPLYVVSEIIGVPQESRGLLKQSAVDIVRFLGTPPATYLPMAGAALRSLDEATEYLQGLVAHRKSMPRHDLISVLLSDKGTSEEQVVATCVMMIFAGFETTSNLLANGLLLLLRNPEQLALLRERPELLPSAIEEMLRVESPVQRLSRMATTDLELGGKHIRSGDLVFFMTGAANRDPAAFDRPEHFDITRDHHRNLAFGSWIHTCPGSGLARMEAEITFGELLRKASDIRLSEESVTWQENLSVRALEKLTVVFGKDGR